VFGLAGTRWVTKPLAGKLLTNSVDVIIHTIKVSVLFHSKIIESAYLNAEKSLFSLHLPFTSLRIRPYASRSPATADHPPHMESTTISLEDGFRRNISSSVPKVRSEDEADAYSAFHLNPEIQKSRNRTGNGKRARLGK
jgi:hypothetical protein